VSGGPARPHRGAPRSLRQTAARSAHSGRRGALLFVGHRAVATDDPYVARHQRKRLCVASLSLAKARHRAAARRVASEVVAAKALDGDDRTSWSNPSVASTSSRFDVSSPWNASPSSRSSVALRSTGVARRCLCVKATVTSDRDIPPRTSGRAGSRPSSSQRGRKGWRARCSSAARSACTS
jgi:hypothetical protein